MDCPSEETLIRLKLEYVSSINGLYYEIPNRKLTVYSNDYIDLIDARISELNLDSSVLSTTEVDKIQSSEASDQRKVLIAVLVINFAFFINEISTGIISKSIGLMADSLDMLADAKDH